MNMENDKPHENFWACEAALTRKIGAGTLAAAWALAIMGRSSTAAKTAAIAGGALVVAEIERRIAKKNEQ